MPEELKLLHSQLGYRNGHQKKRLVVPDLTAARTIFGDRVFWVMEQNDFSKHLLNAPNQSDYTYRAGLKREHTDFGPWLIGDIACLRNDGVYQAFLGGAASPTFVIRDDVYRRVIPMCINYFQVQSCGRNVPGWHDACHLDDGYIVEEDRYVDAAYGWHDAGDFRKWASSTCMIAFSLLVAHRLWQGREEKLRLPPGVFLAEAMQGYEYFLNIQQADGSLLHNIGGGARTVHDNEDCRYTDNVKQSGDERRIHPGVAMPPAKYTALYALYAEALQKNDPEKSNRALEAAKRSLAYDLRTEDVSLDNIQWRAWSYLVLHRVTGESEYKTAAIQWTNRIVDLQVTEYLGGQSLTRGFWRAHPEDPAAGFHRKHVGSDYHIWILAECIDEYADHPDATRWKDAITLWVDELALVFAARNPFGLLPYAFYEERPEGKQHYAYRQLGERLCFRYFLANEGRISNARCCCASFALAAAARVLQRPELMDDAYRLLEWIHGANPWQISTMNGVGVYQPDPLSFQMGRIPGGVTLGPGGDEADMPFYLPPRSCTDEYYGYQTSQFLWAALALEAMPR